MSNHLSPNAGEAKAGADHPADTPPVTAAAMDASPGPGAGKDAKKRKKQRARVRGAWIAFVGRIVAQFVGSAATIVLGLALIERHHAALTAAQVAAAPAASVAAAAPPDPASRVPPGSTVLVVPLQVSADHQQALIEQLAVAIRESLGQNVSVAVVSNPPIAPVSGHKRAPSGLGGERTAGFVLEDSIASRSAVR